MRSDSKTPEQQPLPLDTDASSMVTLSHAFDRRSVRFRDARVCLILKKDQLQRFVIIDSEKLRTVLGQPRRQELPELSARRGDTRLRLSELWALGEAQARHTLRRLYQQAGEQAAVPNRPREQVALGHRQPVQIAAPPIRGELLFAGHTEQGLFCVELLEDGRRVRSITGIDLARALDVAGVEVGEMILIERGDDQLITIREEHSGTHGDSKRTLNHRRDVFRITKERAAALPALLDHTLRSDRSRSRASEAR